MSDVRDSAGGGGRQYAAYNVVAAYADVDAARNAITALERSGVEGGDIELFGEGAAGANQPKTNLEQRSADMAATAAVGKRAISGIVLGAVAGAVIGAVAALIYFSLQDDGDVVVVAVIGAAVAAGIFGAFAGGFYGGATGLPVSEAWGETFETVHGGQAFVAVHSQSAGEVDTAVEALRGTQPLRLARFGADGRLVDA